MVEERWRKGFLFRFLVVPFGVGGTGVAVPDEEEELLMLSISSAVTRWTLSKASRKAESSCSSKASRLLRMVPEKRTGSWGIIARRERRACSFILEISRPSMWIDHSLASRKRNKASVKDDLPAPVRPTTPIRSLRSTRKVKPLRTGGRSGA